MSTAAASNEPIILKPERVKRKYTGGKLLGDWLGEKNPVDGNEPEAWLVSTVAAMNVDSRAGEGLSKTTLRDGKNYALLDLIKENPVAYLGEDYVSAHGEQLGVLARAGDSAVRLILQVHPSREKALRYLGVPYGKPESWYIFKTRSIGGEKPHVFVGLKKGTTRERFIELFEKQDIHGMLSCLHKIDVKNGEVYFLPAGMPHTVGPGCLFVEFHEPSDITLRLEKEYLGLSRLEDDELHYGMGYANMYDCIDFTEYTLEELRQRITQRPVRISSGDTHLDSEIVSSRLSNSFVMRELRIRGTYSYEKDPVFNIGVVLEGTGELAAGGSSKRVKPGDGFLLPARLTCVEIRGEELTILTGLPS